MKFQGYEHKLRYDQSRDRLNDEHRVNVRYVSALYVLTSRAMLTDKMDPFFNDGDFRMQDFLENTEFNKEEQLMVELAKDLFAENYTVSNNVLVSTLSYVDYHVAAEASNVRLKGIEKGYAIGGDMYF